MSLVIYNKAERSFRCTQQQAATLDVLAGMRHGGLGSWVRGYRPTTGYTVSPIVDIQILTSFSVGKVYERRKAALEKITFAEVAEGAAKHPLLKHLATGEIFLQYSARKEKLVETLTTTLSGVREDNHRQGVDRCYIHVTKGVRVNVKGERIGDIKELTLVDGLPIAESILVSYLEISRVVLDPGIPKRPPNSGIPVLIGNIIESKLNSRSVEIKTLSLKSDNFISLDLARNLMLSSELLALV